MPWWNIWNVIQMRFSPWALRRWDHTEKGGRGAAPAALPVRDETDAFFLGNLSFEGRKGGWRIIAIAHFLQKYFHLWICWRRVARFLFPPNSYPPPHPTSQDILDWWICYRIEDARGITDLQYLNRKEKSQCEWTTGNWKQILDGTLLF